jgi:hypothetical protein
VELIKGNRGVSVMLFESCEKLYNEGTIAFSRERMMAVFALNVSILLLKLMIKGWSTGIPGFDPWRSRLLALILIDANWMVPEGLFWSFLHDSISKELAVSSRNKTRVCFFKGIAFKKERVQETQNPLFQVKNQEFTVFLIGTSGQFP